MSLERSPRTLPALALLTILTLAGCGGGSDATPAAGGGTSAPAATDSASASASASASESASASAPAATGAAALPEEIKKAGKVKVASDVSYAPVEFFAADGKTVTGFDYDLGQALGKKLGVAFEFTNTGFDGIIPAVQARRFDIIMSAMTDNPKRQQVLDFVDYFTAGTSIIVKKGNPKGITGLDSLCGQTVAVEKGTVQVDVVTAQQAKCGSKKIDLKTLPKDTDALLQVKSGRAVADINDSPVADYNAKTSGGGNDFEVVLAQSLGTAPYGIGVLKSNAGLRDAIKGALGELVADGTYKAILTKYGAQDGALKAVTVNGGK